VRDEQRTNLLERSVVTITAAAKTLIIASVIVIAGLRLAEKYRVLSVTHVHPCALTLTALRKVSLRTSVGYLRVDANSG